MPLDAPCKKGHVGHRSPTTRKCLECSRLRDAKRRQDPEVRERYRLSSAKWNAENRDQKLAELRQRYSEDEAFRERAKANSRRQTLRYATDDEFRKTVLSRASAYHKRRLATDEGYREQCKAYGRAYHHRHKATPEYRAKVTSPEFRAKVSKQAALRFQRPEVKQRHNERGRAWATKNRDKIAAKASRRRAEQDKRTPPWLTSDHHTQILGFYQEAKRLTEETGTSHHVDHIVPLRGKGVSGLHVPWNLQVLTASANVKKGNRFT